VACMRGDRDAWETLVRTYSGLVYSIIRRYGFDDDEAADIFQEVWVAAWDGLSSLRDERGLASWLATVASRTALRALRRRIRHPVATGEAYDTEAHNAPDPDLRPDEAAVDAERGAEVRAAISALPERDRKLVHYFFYDPSSPSYAEIARRLGVSPETVGPLRTRCLRRLRAALRESHGLADVE
jgi:RNA polymerase sigma factor (sigma-70 family)